MTTVILVPAIEFAPHDFTQNFEAPESNTFEDCNSNWLAALADSGITELTPIALDSWCVAVSQIRREHTIQMLLNCHLEYLSEIMASRNLCELFDNTGPIVGGYFLIVDNAITIEPGCCADLASIDEWEAALEGNSTWQGLWNGHDPFLFSRCLTKDIVEFAYDVPQLNLVKSKQFSENSANQSDEVQRFLSAQHSVRTIRAAIRISELTVAIRKAQQELIDFREIVKPILNEFVPALLVEPMLDVMLYGRRPSDEQLLDLVSGLSDWIVDHHYFQKED